MAEDHYLWLLALRASTYCGMCKNKYNTAQVLRRSGTWTSKQIIQTKDKGKIFDTSSFMLVPQWFAISQKVGTFSLAGLFNSSETLCVYCWLIIQSPLVFVSRWQSPLPMSRGGRESHLASKHRRINSGVQSKYLHETQWKLKGDLYAHFQVFICILGFY